MEVTGTEKVFAPVQLGPVTLRNRIIKAATFEGMAIKNLVSEALIDFHIAFAQGGIGMTTLAYCAVSQDGQGAPNEIVVREEAIPGLRRLVNQMHSLDVAASMQLGHAGPVGIGAGGRGLSASKVLAKQRMKKTYPASEEDLLGVINDFVVATKHAANAGFDCVELHFGHGYLVSNFLSPSLNKRQDRWGGSIENRARLGREIAKQVRASAPDSMAVIAKLNMDDGVKGGLHVQESIEVAKMLESDGSLDAIELTGGSSFENPMYLFRGDVPVNEMAQIFPKALRLPFKLTAKKFMPYYPFKETYFLEHARFFRQALSMPLILLGGINKLESVEKAIEEGFEYVAMGRALLREPDLINRWMSGTGDDGICIHCNKCMPSIYQGTHCYLVPFSERPGHAKWPPPVANQVGTHD